MPDCKRVIFFEEQLLDLQQASSKGYNALLDACIQSQLLFEKSFPSIPAMDINQHQSYLNAVPTDEYSKSILPQEWKHVCPIKCYGDGNCLYRYVFRVHVRTCSLGWDNNIIMHIM